MSPSWDSNLQNLDLQLDALSTALWGSANKLEIKQICKN